MQQQIRGWRFAAEEAPRRRFSRGASRAPITPSAKVTGAMLRMACRALARRAMKAQAEQRMRMAHMGGRARAGGTMRMAGPMRMARTAGTMRPEGANMMRIAGGAGLAAAGIGVA